MNVLQIALVEQLRRVATYRDALLVSANTIEKPARILLVNAEFWKAVEAGFENKTIKLTLALKSLTEFNCE